MSKRTSERIEGFWNKMYSWAAVGCLVLKNGKIYKSVKAYGFIHICMFTYIFILKNLIYIHIIQQCGCPFSVRCYKLFVCVRVRACACAYIN
jgi:hypothetical protein